MPRCNSNLFTSIHEKEKFWLLSHSLEYESVVGKIPVVDYQMQGQ